MTEAPQPDSSGGLLSPEPVNTTLHPDECVIFRRDGKWRCLRDHVCVDKGWWLPSPRTEAAGRV